MKTILRKTIPHEVEISLSGADVADLFWELDEHAQSDFFNRLGFHDRLVFQLQAVADCDELNSVGRAVMRKIGEYAEPSV